MAPGFVHSFKDAQAMAPGFVAAPRVIGEPGEHIKEPRERVHQSMTPGIWRDNLARPSAPV